MWRGRRREYMAAKIAIIIINADELARALASCCVAAQKRKAGLKCLAKMAVLAARLPSSTLKISAANHRAKKPGNRARPVGKANASSRENISAYVGGHF